ncbi:MAG: hypothetical protein GY754_16510 [bacterium]|nr:hypothetical protein [bacterium]
MDIKKLFRRNLFLLPVYAMIIFFFSACSNQGSWDISRDQAEKLREPKPVISLSTPAGNAIAENNQTGIVRVTLSKTYHSDVTVQLSCSGTASTGTDYSANITTVVIPAGKTSVDVAITTIDDSVSEGNENIIVAIDSVVNGTEDGVQQTELSITDDDSALVSLSGGGALAEDGSSQTLTVSLSTTSVSDITVNLAYSGNAANTTDYTRSADSVTIPAGSTTAAFQITSVADALDETNETVSVDIDSVVNAVENGTQQETITITDDDASPTIQFTAASSSGDESASPVSVELSLSAVSALAVDVSFSLSGTATGADYTLAAGTASISAGTTTTNISIPIINDLFNETSETIVITISAPVNAALGGNTTHTYTINDNDAAPQVQFTTTSSSGSEAATPAAIGVSLSAVSGQPVSVDYIVSGSATGGGTDYTLANGTANIAAGSTTAAISVIISNDVLEENDETIIITLSNPGKASLGTNTVFTYTITDNNRNGPAITTAEYYDSDSNGYLDHIKITLDETVNDSSFDGYGGANNLGSVTSKWAIAGYANVRINTGYAGDVDNDSVIWLKFDENGSTHDTGATPELTVTDASLKDLDSGNCYFNTSNTACTDQTAADLAAGGVTETDKAAPVLVDAVGSVDYNKVIAIFSEPVDGDGGTCDTNNLELSDFAYTNTSGCSASSITSMSDANACDDNAVTIDLNTNFTAADASTDTMNAVLSSVFDSANNSAKADTTVITNVHASTTTYFTFSGSVSDSSGNNNTLTSAGDPELAADRNSNSNSAYYMPGGLNGYFSNTDTSRYCFQSEMTLSIRINAVYPESDAVILLKERSNTSYAYSLEMKDNKLFSAACDTAGNYADITGSTIPASTWVHLAITWKTGGKYRAYMNGKLVQEVNASSANLITATSAERGSFYIGTNTNRIGSWKQNSFSIDDLRMYDRELSPTEIYALYLVP